MIYKKENPVIFLSEWNGGFQSHEPYQKVLKICKDKIEDIFSHDSSESIKKLPKWSLEQKVKFSVLGPNPVQFEKLLYKIELKLKLYPVKKNKEYPIQGGGWIGERGKYEIHIYLDENESLNYFRSHKDIIFQIISHEIVHLFKDIYKNKQRTADEFLDDEGRVVWDKYFSDKHELDAFISQTIEEMKSMNVDGNSNFSNLILKSKTFNDIRKNVKNQKVMKKLLSKVYFFWKKELTR